MKIEEIRKRHSAGYVTMFATPMEVINDYNAEVLYLLAKLEIAKEALDDVLYETDIPVPDIQAIIRVTRDALKAIRE